MDKPAQWALVAAAWFLALSVAVFGTLALRRAEGRGSIAPAQGPAAWSAGDAGGTAVCPVTGERVRLGPDTPRVIYLGRTYYFSTARDAQGRDARTRFLMDPERWTKRPGNAP